MSHTYIDPSLLIPAKRATSQEPNDITTTVVVTSAATSGKDQDRKHTTSSRGSRRLSFKRTRRDTPDSDDDSENDDYTIEHNQDGAQDTEGDNDDDDDEESKAKDNNAENVTESLAVQEERKDEEEVEEVDYEAQRKRNILENQRLLQELGLNKSIIRKSFPTVVKNDNYDDEEEVSSDGEYNDEIGSREPRKGRRIARSKLSWRNSATAVATRASKRIRGEAAGDSKVDLEALERSLNSRTGGNNEDGEVVTTPPLRLGEYSRSLWKGRKQTTGFTMEMEIPSASAPLTVGSIATTIWELGSIYKGEKNKLKYWSGGGSLFKHPYPIGYRAEKFYFRERYMMHIKEGPEGPIFIVESASGRVFEGSSPTLPWTKVCLASSSKGTRISGPLFFGFSDPITQKMIEGLDGYQTWEQVKAEVQEAEALATEAVEK